MTSPIELIGIVITIVAVVGVLLNNARRRACFLLWIVSNALSAAVHIHADLYSLAARDAIFLVLAVIGWRQWGVAIGDGIRPSSGVPICLVLR